MVSAVMAVSVMTATPLNLNPPFPDIVMIRQDIVAEKRMKSSQAPFSLLKMGVFAGGFSPLRRRASKEKIASKKGKYVS